MSSIRYPYAFAVALGALCAGQVVAAPAGHCRFDAASLQFAGDAQVQAGCLLREVRPGGDVDPAARVVPASLAALIGTQTGTLKPAFQAFLNTGHITEASLGGSLTSPLSAAGDGTRARYFVIHDTSAPYLRDAPFPANDARSVNRMTGYAGPESKAHVFVNRLGATLTGHDFSVPWRATKLELNIIGAASRGLFLHIELVQPRRRDPQRPGENDALAPNPGFTQAQYDRLAQLYVAASVRGGTWLIPAFHGAIYDGITGAHDDPQNFDLEQFAASVAALRQQLGGA